VAEWPVVGKSVHGFWTSAATDIESAVEQFRPQFAAVGETVLKSIGATVFGLFQFIASILIAGVLMLSADSGYKSSCTIATALAGQRGPGLIDMSIATIRSVTKGVVGVAIIQALLSGIGLVAMDVPAAGIWAALVLVLAVIQLPPLLVLGPIVIWVFSVSDPVTATIFAVYALIVSMSDSFLKPMFLGRGMDIPVLVILIGAIGGAISFGLLGLFLGPVVLAVGYKILIEWMATHEVSNELQGDQQ
jgi:predicted PurR-regulated permease PerM